MDRSIWKPVVGFEGYYEVSNRGHIRSLCRTAPGPRGSTRLIRGKIISPSLAKNGYLRVCLCRPDLGKRYHSALVHRVVAEAFLPSPAGAIENFEVDHIDENRANCAASNLRWVTSQENISHRDAKGHYAAKKVEAINPITGEVRAFPSVREAAKAYSCTKSHSPKRIITAMHNGSRAFGMNWRFLT